MLALQLTNFKGKAQFRRRTDESTKLVCGGGDETKFAEKSGFIGTVRWAYRLAAILVATVFVAGTIGATPNTPQTKKTLPAATWHLS